MRAAVERVVAAAEAGADFEERQEALLSLRLLLERAVAERRGLPDIQAELVELLSPALRTTILTSEETREVIARLSAIAEERGGSPHRGSAVWSLAAGEPQDIAEPVAKLLQNIGDEDALTAMQILIALDNTVQVFGLSDDQQELARASHVALVLDLYGALGIVEELRVSGSPELARFAAAVHPQLVKGLER